MNTTVETGGARDANIFVVHNALRYVKKMRSAGVPEAQAEVHAEAIAEIAKAIELIETNVVTKNDLKEFSKEVDNKLDKLSREFDGKLDRLAKDVDGKLDRLTKDVDSKLDKFATKQELKEVEMKLELRLKELELHLVVKLGSMFLGGGGALVFLMKVLHI